MKVIPSFSFQLLKHLLQPPDSITPHIYFSDTCDSLMFFNTKIEKIHQHFTLNPLQSSSIVFPTESQTFSSFYLPPAWDISALILKLKPSTGQLDSLPTVFAKDLPSLLPLINALIHSSLTSGIVSTPFKSTSVTPPFENCGSDFDDFKWPRSKVLQKIVAV